KENIEIEKKYNFNHLIPPIEWYKEIIDEYCSIMDPIKLEPLQNQINTLKIQLSNSQANSAKARIQNQLSYKLGQAMIENSKSILGYIRMPYVLSYIKDKHKQEQKIYQEKIKKDPSLKLPPLESYADYNEALKFKEHLSYKLGEALIKANNNWYGGGYIKLWFEIRRIKKEFKNKKV
ncbi:sugar transferase, partial [Campylobacter sp. RM12397]|nr:sugar transferase [Campylobacter sp. RM12397]